MGKFPSINLISSQLIFVIEISWEPNFAVSPKNIEFRNRELNYWVAKNGKVTINFLKNKTFWF